MNTINFFKSERTSRMQTPGLNHIILTVFNTERSRAFYSELLSFPVTVLEEDLDKSFFIPSRQPIPNDRFSEFRLGLDHLSFPAPSQEALRELADKLIATRLETKGVDSSPLQAIGMWHSGIQITFNWNTGYRDRRI